MDADKRVFWQVPSEAQDGAAVDAEYYYRGTHTTITPKLAKPAYVGRCDNTLGARAEQFELRKRGIDGAEC
jgi:hypothetical protein